MNIPPAHIPISEESDDAGRPLIQRAWYLALNELAKQGGESSSVTIDGVPVTY